MRDTVRTDFDPGPAATILAALALVAAPCRAVDVPVVNPGFEDITGESQFNEFTFGPLNGWDLHDPGGITDGGDGPTFYIGTLTPFEADPKGNPGVYVNFPDGAAEGMRVGICFNFAGSGDTGEYGFVQTLDAVLEPMTTYRLEVEIGNIASGTAMSGQFFDLDGFPGYRVEFLAGGAVVAQDDNGLFGLIPEGTFATSTVTLTTGAADAHLGEALAIRLVNLNEIDPAFPAANLEVDFDHVRLSADPACPGDVTGDASVGFDDLLAVLGCWSDAPLPPDCVASDVDGDGAVSFGDLLVVLGAWGPCAP